MRLTRGFAVGLMATVALLACAPAFAVDGQTMIITGEDYTKWLWGTQRTDDSVYNFTTVPGEGYGENGQGTEIDLYLFSKPNKYVEVQGRLQSRFNQNEWTNYGGFGGSTSAPCLGGSCGEFDPRSNQYIKLRGLTARFTPGFKWLDSATIGSNDLGMFDPFTIGKIRYIDRDNAGAILFQGSLFDRKLGYDLIRVSLPRLFAGPNFNTGTYTSQDSAYGLQLKLNPSPMFDIVGVVERVRDVETNPNDTNIDNGTSLIDRFTNDVYGVRLGIHPSSKIDIRGNYYYSKADSNPTLTPTSFGTSGFSPTAAGKLKDPAYKADVDLNDPFGIGLSFNLEYFNIGAQYESIMAARRESDVLLTEGHDGAFVFPGPDNSAFGVFPGNPTRIGFGGWEGNAQQVATLSVDNEFTDFDEAMAETVIGWKGFTVVPTWTIGKWDLAAEATHIDYNTNWQAWGFPNKAIDNSIYPNFESDAGVASYRNAFAPFQDRKTDLYVLKGKTVVDVAKGIDVFGKLKYIKETDDRMTDPRFLPYKPGDCPGGGVACHNNTNAYNGNGNSTAAIYGNPPVITVNGVTGYQWKPFDSLSDDDKDMKYKMYQLGAGYQFTGDLYTSLTYEYYDVDLKDGDTAFQAYNLHTMAAGSIKKNKLMLIAKYTLGGAEFGLNYEYNFGTYNPDFGGGFVTQFADATIAHNFGVPVGSPGFTGRFGGWNSLIKRDFNENRLKAFMKVRF
ncbi:MAG: hypothetical protein WAM82_07045 [Thermoanaerobaculia bacterium]